MTYCPTMRHRIFGNVCLLTDECTWPGPFWTVRADQPRRPTPPRELGFCSGVFFLNCWKYKMTSAKYSIKYTYVYCLPMYEK